MREYLPYAVLGAAVVAAWIHRRGGLKAIPPASPKASAINAVIETAADAFAYAQKLAREEAHVALDRRFADEAQKKAFAVYHAPFSGPPAEDKPAA